MSSKTTKAKRKALPGVSLAELMERGELDSGLHLRDHVDMNEAALARGIERRLEREAAQAETKNVETLSFH